MQHGAARHPARPGMGWARTPEQTTPGLPSLVTTHQRRRPRVAHAHRRHTRGMWQACGPAVLMDPAASPDGSGAHFPGRPATTTGSLCQYPHCPASPAPAAVHTAPATAPGLIVPKGVCAHTMPARRPFQAAALSVVLPLSLHWPGERPCNSRRHTTNTCMQKHTRHTHTRTHSHVPAHLRVWAGAAAPTCTR